MRKIFTIFIVTTLFFTACENTGSSTVGTYDKEENSASEDKNEAPPYVDTSREFVGSTVKKDSGTVPEKKQINTQSAIKAAAKP